jgi:hypothetical protein
MALQKIAFFVTSNTAYRRLPPNRRFAEIYPEAPRRAFAILGIANK